MKTFKKISIALLIVLSLLTAVFFTACEPADKGNHSADNEQSQSNDQSQDQSQSGGQEDVTLVINSEMLSIEEDDTFTLTVSKSDNSEVGAVTWASSDPTIASVDGGVVTAIIEGNATITATAGGLTATCAVTVFASEEYPVMELSRYNAVLLAGDEATVDVSATYKGKSAKLSAVTASSGDEEVATVAVDGTTVTVTAVAYGETTVTIASSYRGKSMLRNVAVKVNEDVQLTLDESAVLYTYAFGEYKNEKDLTAAVVVNGQKVEAPAIEWAVDDETVATVSGGKINALSIGEATVTAKYVSASGIEYSADCVVTVKKTSADLGTRTELYLNPADGSKVFSLTEDIGAPALGDYVMTDAATGEEIALTDAVGGYTVDLSAGNYKVRLSSASANAEFTAELTVISKVIMTLEELENFADYGEVIVDDGNTFTVRGFFVLGANIDATGHEFKKYRLYTYAEDKTMGLVGGFDGKGHTIYGGTYYLCGIFGQIAEGSVIRNLAVNNATLPFENAGGVIANYNYGTIDNCLVEVSEFDASYCQVSALCNINHGTISNCVTDYPLVGKNNDASGAICQYNYGEVLNCYAITGDRTFYNAGGGTADARSFDYGTPAYDITFTGLGEYFDVTGEKIAFVSLSEMMAEIEAKKEAAAKAFIGDVIEQTIVLHNGNEAELIKTIEYTAYEIIGLDEEYAAFITVKDGKMTVSEEADENFTFGVKYYYTKDAAVAKTVTYSVVTTTILDRSVDMHLSGDLAFDVTALGLEAGSAYALELSDGTALDIEVSGTMITVAGLEAGEYTVVLDVDGDKYQFTAVVITEVITTADQLAAFAARKNDAYYVLGADIDASALSFMNVNTFSGTFDGRGYVIYGGTYVSPNDNHSNGGLFGRVEDGSVIKNLVLINCSLKGEYSWSNCSLLTGNANMGGTLKDSFFEITEVGVVNGDYNGVYVPVTSKGVVGHLNDGVIENVVVFNRSKVILNYGICDMVLGSSSIADTYFIGDYAQANGWNEDSSPVSVIKLSTPTEEQQTKLDAWYHDFIEDALSAMEIADLSLQNGDEIALPALPNGVEWAVTYADASFDGSIALSGKKLTVNAVKEGSFKFTLTATYAADETLNKAFEFTVEYVVVVSKPVQLLVGGDMKVDLVNDLGVAAGSEYTLKEGDAAVSFTANENAVYLNGLEVGEHDLVLTVDGTIVKFKAVVANEIITTAEQLAAFASRTNNGYYVLGGNVDASDYTLMNTDATFDGTFNGCGYAIMNATFSSANGNKAGGLFGTINPGAVIKNLAITGATLTTEADYNWVYTSVLTGGGRFKGTLEQCYIEITQKGSSIHAMGIACHLEDGTIKNVILKSVSGLEKNIGDMVLGASSVSNTYVIGGSATNNGWNQNGSPVSVTNVSSLTEAQQEAFDKDIWGFENGLPYFKNAQA